MSTYTCNCKNQWVSSGQAHGHYSFRITERKLNYAFSIQLAHKMSCYKLIHAQAAKQILVIGTVSRLVQDMLMAVTLSV